MNIRWSLAALEGIYSPEANTDAGRRRYFDALERHGHLNLKHDET